MSDTQRFVDQAHRFRSWLVQKALPFWATASFDPDGGVYEALARDGSPLLNVERRTRIMSRQAYTYAHAAAQGWAEDGRRLSDDAFESLIRLGSAGVAPCDAKFDGFPHLLAADRSVANETRDCYDHTFAILASTWRYNAFGNAADLKNAGGVMAFLDRTLGQADGSYLEGMPASLPRRQNPHMHMFEASMAYARATDDDADHDRCHRLFALFQSCFFDSDAGVIREFFAQDWSLDPDRADFIEPGHMAEWAWLIDQYAEQYNFDLRDLIDLLFANAVAMGWNDKTGLLADVVTLGTDYPDSPTHRLWGQTEYLKATCAKIRLGHTDGTADAAALIDRLFKYYIDPAVPGGYFDQVDGTGELTKDTMTPSTLYHLVSAAAEVDRTAAMVS